MNQIKEKKPIIRTIFLDLLKISFIVLVYFYTSEFFGSISTPFITISDFSIQFGMTLLIYSFLSILSGPYIAFVSGFLAEFLYQLAFYDNVSLEWNLIIAIFGFSTSMYKYKPLKYENKKNIFFSIILLIVSSLITMFLIVVFQIMILPNPVDFNTIIINSGLSFLVTCIISVIFLVPLLLIAYDKAFAKNERFIYNELLTHHPISASDHAFHLEFGRTRIYFCSRCSGVIIGGLISMFSTHLWEEIYDIEFNPQLSVLLCVILPIPGLIDWGTQRILLRKSTTESRLFTGFIIGTALHLMSFTTKYSFFMLFLVIFYFGILFLFMYIGHKKQIKLMNREIELIPEKKRKKE